MGRTGLLYCAPPVDTGQFLHRFKAAGDLSSEFDRAGPLHRAGQATAECFIEINGTLRDELQNRTLACLQGSCLRAPRRRPRLISPHELESQHRPCNVRKVFAECIANAR
jgi:hypothetical protein